MELSAETERVLGRISAENRQIAVRGMTQVQAWQLVEPVVHDVVDEVGVSRAGMRNSYFLAGREMTRLFRTLAGPKLADALRLLLRKWVHYGQDPGLAQRVLVACIEKLGTRPEAPAAQAPAKARPRRRHRTYLESLEQGATSKSGRGTAEEQAAEHRAAVLRSKETSAKVRAVLLELGVPMRQFVRYNAFAYKLGHLQRHYTAKMLEQTALGLVDRYEAQGLDRTVLLALCRKLAGINAD